MSRFLLSGNSYGFYLSVLTAIASVVLENTNTAMANDAVDFSKVPASGQQVAQKLALVDLPAASIQYWIYLPRNYDANDRSKKWPVMLFLHGAGESGTDLEKVKKHGPPKLAGTMPELEQFIVVSPQATETSRPITERWDARELQALIQHILTTTQSDQDRVYLTGLSMGGFGSWRLAAQQPGLFAAVVPICGGGKTQYAEALKSLPIWAFHGDMDTVVPLKASAEMIESIRAAGGQPKLTVYKGVSHDSWTVTYKNPELYQWLLEQHR